MARRFRLEVRTSKERDGRFALGYGLRVGYWPCLKAPFLQVAFYRWRVEVWHGLPSYQDDERKVIQAHQLLRRLRSFITAKSYTVDTLHSLTHEIDAALDDIP